TNPGEPTNPGTPPTNPGEPTNPGTPPTNPGEPTNPGTPPTNPGEPTNPGTPPTNPGEPTNPGTPPTNPGEPTNPGTPPTNPGEPTNPGTPPTNTGGSTTTGSTPTTSAVQLPPAIVQEINSLKDLILGYPSELPTADELDRLLALYNNYLKMTPAQKREFEKLVDIDALRDLLLAEGVKLPQTNGDFSTATTMFGLALLAAAALLVARRRKEAN
ncbi:LPXTG cell wall anchor domain-containing protein, partial [Solibacillus silvestris]|uniref:LPXTG cell wall anchor domain-containing protein n=1 Tax=Solibacillus silvestris TaxID=76853 RepID=UPI003F7DE33E